jgi:hypothetical protein
MTKAKSSNWAKAPQRARSSSRTCAPVFGDDVKVLYVKEGSLELGEVALDFVPVTFVNEQKKAA